MYETRFDGDIERVRSWASIIEENTIQQALTSSRSPAVSGPIALMPDAHLGAGSTVGSVIPTKGAILPSCCGVDIACGVAATKLNITELDLPDDLTPILRDMEVSIPAGLGKWHGNASVSASRYLDNNPFPMTSEASSEQFKKAAVQLGTLGSGNHYTEMCIDMHGSIWAVLHSGSRGIGNWLATNHIRKAKQLAKDFERRLDDPDLAYFLESDEGFNAYIADLLWAQDYAFENRRVMMDAFVGVLRKHLPPFMIEDEINVHHNYTAREVHNGQEMWITRKGAIRAQAGDRGVIPGSMGTATYIVTGLGNPDSYNSASHGAGRMFGRKEAKRRFNAQDLGELMKGRTWQSDKAEQLIDESPQAYKSIDVVMDDQKDLVSVDNVLHAVINYKGTS